MFHIVIVATSLPGDGQIHQVHHPSLGQSDWLLRRRWQALKYRVGLGAVARSLPWQDGLGGGSGSVPTDCRLMRRRRKPGAAQFRAQRSYNVDSPLRNTASVTTKADE
jgi:hypothetical protein